MTVRSYRIVKHKWQDSAFDGEGARRFPGRWNNRGTPMLYTASTRSLAILEILVHFEAEDLLREHFVVFELSIPDACLLQLDTALPDDWMEPPVTASTRTLAGNASRNWRATYSAVSTKRQKTTGWKFSLTNALISWMAPLSL